MTTDLNAAARALIEPLTGCTRGPRGAIATLADTLEAERAKVAEARLEGWRAGRDAAAGTCVLSGQDLAEGGWGPEGRDMAVMLEARILALPEPKEDSHD